MTHLADMGVLSVELLLPVLSLLPLANGVEDFLGAEEPKPTGVILGAEPRPPLRMLEDRLTEEPPRGLSSELRETLEPVLDGGLEPFLEPGAALDRRKDIISSP